MSLLNVRLWQVEEAQAALARKHREQQEIIDRAVLAENDRDATAVREFRFFGQFFDGFFAQLELRKVRGQLEESETCRQSLERAVSEAKEQLRRREVVISAHQKTEVLGSSFLDTNHCTKKRWLCGPKPRLCSTI